MAGGRTASARHECPRRGAPSNGVTQLTLQQRAWRQSAAGVHWWRPAVALARWPRPLPSTMRIRSAAFLAPSFSMMRARCTSIVRGLMPSSRPASLLEAPCAMRPRTSSSRAVRRSRPGKSWASSALVGGHVLPAADRVAHARHNGGRVERLFDEIERAVADRLDRRGNIAEAGNDEDRRRIVVRIDLFQQIDARATGQMHIDEHACRRSGSAPPQERTRRQQSPWSQSPRRSIRSKARSGPKGRRRQ